MSLPESLDQSFGFTDVKQTLLSIHEHLDYVGRADFGLELSARLPILLMDAGG
jgi:hypothetical protein